MASKNKSRSGKQQSESSIESAGVQSKNENLSVLVERARLAEEGRPDHAGWDEVVALWKAAVDAAPTEAWVQEEWARVLEAAGRFPELLELLRGCAGSAQLAPDLRAAFWRRVAHVYRVYLRQDGPALQALQHAAKEAPQDALTLEQIASLCEAMKRWPDVLHALHQLVALSESKQEKVKIFHQMGQLFVDRLGNLAEAAKVYEKVLELDPVDAQARAQLIGFYEKRRDWDKWVALHRQEIDLSSDGEERLRRAVALARAADEKIKRVPLSIALWEQVLALDPNHLEALRELEKGYERERQWDKVGAVGEALLTLEQDDKRKLSLFQKLGLIFTERHKDPARAVAMWEGAFSLEPDNKRTQETLKKMLLEQGRFDALAVLMARLGRQDEYVRLLDRAAETAQGAAQVDLLLRAGQVMEEALRQRDRAIRYFEKVRSLDADNVAAEDALVRLYDPQKEPAQWIEVQSAQLERLPRGVVWAERAAVLAERLQHAGSSDRALVLWSKIVEMEDSPVVLLASALQGVETLSTGRPQWETVVALILGRLNRASLPVERTLLQKTLARIYEAELGEVARAVSVYEQLAQEEDCIDQALAALERLYQLQDKPDALLSVYERKLGRVLSPSQEREERYRIAGLLRSMPARLGDAAAWYEQILASSENLVEESVAWNALQELYSSQERWDKLEELLRSQLALYPERSGARCVELLFALGQVREQHLHDVPAAVDCYVEALRVQPHHIPSRHALAAFIENPSYQQQVIAILPLLYEADGDWGGALSLYEKAEGLLPRGSAEQVEMLQRMAGIWDTHLRAPEKAYAAYKKIFEQDPLHPHAREQLEYVAEKANQWAELPELFTRAVDVHLLDSTAAVLLLLRAADVAENKLAQLEQATQLYRRVLEFDPLHREALQGLERVLVAQQRWPDVIEVYGRKLELDLDAAEQQALLLQMAHVWEDKIHNKEQTVLAYQELLAIDPNNSVALLALERLFTEQGRSIELIENLEQQLALAPGVEEKAGLLRKMALLQEQDLGNIGQAIDAYRRVLGLFPTDKETAAGLERLLAIPGNELEVCEILEGVLLKQEDWAGLLRVQEKRLVQLPEGPARAQVLVGMADTAAHKIKDLRSAWGYLARAVVQDPAQATLEQLEALSGELGEIAKLCDIFRGIAADAIETALQVFLWRRIALHEQSLGRFSEAAHAYAALCDLMPEDTSVLDALAAMYEKQGQYESVARVLRDQFVRISDDADRLRVQHRLAEVYEKHLQDPAQALEIYQDILLFYPQDPQALAGMERLFQTAAKQDFRLVVAGQLEPLYQQSASWDQLVAVYQAQLDAADTPLERQQRYRQLAELHEEKRGDLSSACSVWMQAWIEQPGWDWAQQETERLARRTHRAAELVHRLSALCEREDVATTSAWRSAVWAVMARLYREELHDAVSAEAILRKLAKEHPSDVDVWQAIATLSLQGHQIESLVHAWENMAALTGDPAQRLALQMLVAGAQWRLLGKSTRAMEVYEQVLEQDPGQLQALAALEQICLERKDYKALSSVYERWAAAAWDSRERVLFHKKVALLAEWLLGDAERAMVLWKQIADTEGDDLEGLDALQRLYARNNEQQALADILRRKIVKIDSPQRALPLYHQLADVFDKKLHRPQDALWTLQEVVQLVPGDRQGWKALLDVQRRIGQPFDVAQALQDCLAARDAWNATTQESLALYEELARLYEQTLHQPQLALESWTHVLALNEAHEEGFASLERLLLAEAQFEDCVALLTQRAAMASSVEEKKALLLRVVGIFKSHMGDVVGAIRAGKEVLSLDPHNESVSLEVKQLYADAGDWAGQAEFLMGRAEAVGDAGQKAAFLLEAADVFEQKLFDGDAAFVVTLAALEADPTQESTMPVLERRTAESGRYEEFWGQLAAVSDLHTKQNAAWAVSLRLKAARVALEPLRRPDEALRLIQPLLRQNPDHASGWKVWVEATRSLQRWEGLVEGLSKLAAMEEDPTERAALLFEMGTVSEFQLDWPESAMDAYKQVLELEPSSLEAYQALERVYQNTQNADALTVLLRKKVTVFSEREIWLPAQYKLAALLSSQKEGVSQAIEVYQAILAQEPSALQALQSLAALYGQQGQQQSQLEVLERCLDWMEEQSEYVALQRRLAEAWEQAGRLDRAIFHWEALLNAALQDEEAFLALERLYRKEQRLSDVVELYKKCRTASAVSARRIELGMALAVLLEQEVGDLLQTIEAYRDVLLENRAHPQALAALARLYEQVGDARAAVDCWSALLALAESSEERVALHLNLARLFGTHLMQYTEAEHHYLQVLGLRPGDLFAAQTLAEQYLQCEEWEKAIQTLLYAKEQTPHQKDKIILLHRLGILYSQLLGDWQQAVEFMTQIQKIDPEHVSSAEFLAEVYYHQQRWDKAEPLLELLLERTEPMDVGRKLDLLGKLANTCDQTNQIEKALGYAKVACDMDPLQIEHVVRYATLLGKAKLLDQAAQLYLDALRRFANAPKEDQVRLHYEMAQVKIKQNDLPRALHFASKVLETDPQHLPTLKLVAGLYASQKRWDEVVRVKRMLIELGGETKEKVDWMNEVAELLHERLHQPQQALVVAEQALALDPQHPALLHRVFTLYVQLEQWRKAVEVLSDLARTETDPFRKGKFHAIAGNFCRDHLKSIDQALDFYNLALDNFFTQPEQLTGDKLQEALRSFEAVDKICTLRKDWQNQERSYRKMLKRLPENGFSAVRVALWHALGEVYHSRLKDIPAAIQAFEVAARLDSTNQKRREILGELYLVAGPDYLDKAVQQYLALIAAQPMQPQAYQTLRRIYKSRGDYDAVWCVCAVLVYLKQASAEETEFFESYRSASLPRWSGVLHDESWTQKLYHPTQDSALTAVFATVGPAAVASQSQEHKRFGLKRKERVDWAQAAHPFLELLLSVQRVLNIAQPFDLFLQPDQAAEFQLANTRDGHNPVLSVIAGRPVLVSQHPQEWAVASGLFLPKLRPEYVARLVFPNARDLESLLQGALALVRPGSQVPPVAQAMQPYLPPEMLAHLQWLIPRVETELRQPDVARWIQAVDLTCHRVALLMTADVPSVVQALQREPAWAGGLNAQAKVKELLTFAVSPEYVALRKQLGIAIE